MDIYIITWTNIIKLGGREGAEMDSCNNGKLLTKLLN